MSASCDFIHFAKNEEFREADIDGEEETKSLNRSAQRERRMLDLNGVQNTQFFSFGAEKYQAIAKAENEHNPFYRG